VTKFGMVTQVVEKSILGVSHAPSQGVGAPASSKFLGPLPASKLWRRATKFGSTTRVEAACFWGQPRSHSKWLSTSVPHMAWPCHQQAGRAFSVPNIFGTSYMRAHIS